MDAAFALNEGGGGRLDGKTGAYQYNGIQAGEKLYQDFTLETVNQGGHSSRPTPDNAIYQMAQALAKIQAFEFPVEFNDATRGYFAKFGEIVGGAQGADMKAVAASGDAAAVDAAQEGPESQRDAAHDMRRHDDQRRPCPERPAATRHGQRQLPHLPRPCARGDSSDAHQDDQ